MDQRAVIDGGFQELVRLGELPATDPDVQNSLAVLDKQISVTTPSGTGYYRYGNSAADGSADGYGDCYQPSQTSCTTPGPAVADRPTPAPGTCGRCCPASGPSPTWPTATRRGPQSQLRRSCCSFASGVGLVPEQAWEDPDLAASPYGTDPTDGLDRLHRRPGGRARPPR